MNRHTLSSAGLIVLAAMMSASCGGDVAGSTGIDGTGILTERDIISMGRVRSLGAIVVNGVRYDTAGASFTIDGSAATAAELRIGDVIVVEGRFDATKDLATATRIVADHILKGAIETVDPIGHSLTAMGQTIQINGDTVFGPTATSGLAGLASGDAITVAGFRNHRGVIIATHIARESSPAGVKQTTGAITDVSSTADRFSINNLVVDYSSAAWLPAKPAGKPARGAFVQVKGSIATGGVIMATTIEIRSDRLGGATDRLAQIEGYITALEVANSTHFKVNGLAVSTSTATQYSGLITVDTPVAVSGTLDVGGTVLASNVGNEPAAPNPPAATSTPAEPVSPTVPTAPTAPTGPLGPFTGPSSPTYPPGPYVEVKGRVFDALSGPLAGATVGIWVQTPGVGYALGINGAITTSGQDGRFTAVVPSGALLMVHATRFNHVQPCVVMVTAAEGADFDVELVPEARLDSENPPPPISAAGATTVSGTVFETVAGIRQPVAGAWIWFGDSMGLTVATTVTDRQGRYVACRMPNDSRWNTWQTELWTGKDGYEDKTVWPFDTSRSQVFDLELRRRQ